MLKIRADDLQGLVAVQARVQLQGRIGDIESGLLERFLEAAQVLRYAVDKRALDIEDIARK